MHAGSAAAGRSKQRCRRAASEYFGSINTMAMSRSRKLSVHDSEISKVISMPAGDLNPANIYGPNGWHCITIGSRSYSARMKHTLVLCVALVVPIASAGQSEVPLATPQTFHIQGTVYDYVGKHPTTVTFTNEQSH